MDYEKLLEEDQKTRKLHKAHRILEVVSIVLSVLLALGALYVCIYSVKLGGILAVLIIPLLVSDKIVKVRYNKQYKRMSRLLEDAIISELGIDEWKFTSELDDSVKVKSSQAVGNYDDIKYFKEYPEKLELASEIMRDKRKYNKLLSEFLDDNKFKDFWLYPVYKKKIERNLCNTTSYCVNVRYISPAGRKSSFRELKIGRKRINELISDKSILMTKSEYNKYLREQERGQLEQKQHDLYEQVNCIIDYANDNKERLVNKSDSDELDRLIASLFDRTINSIKKIKSINSEEWDLLKNFIDNISEDVNKIIDKNNKIIEYYDSEGFLRIKNTCNTLMDTQREFNEYIDEKVKSISDLFGKNTVRNETEIEDEYNYFHPYKKSITPFAAEVSSSVFASAENNPLSYVVKYFYPNKADYPEQIQKLQLLVEELETLREAKQIIENYKKDIQQYLSDVPTFVMDYDEDGFYSRLGFATVNEKTLTVEYKFSYTSGGGKAQRSFTIPMSEETIVELIKALESKLTMSAFTKEQRSLMTSKLRQHIKERDDFTCRYCGNSTKQEPNLLLEIDHIIPVSKGGCTEENNLQTLCWKCNRHKSDKIE